MNSFAPRLAVLALAAAIGTAPAARAANQIVCWKAVASQPCIRTYVGDTEAGLPSSGVPEGFPAWAKDTDRLVCYYGGSWQPCNTGGGGGGDPTLAGDVDGLGSANDLDEVAVEVELEGVLDLADLQGAVTDSQVPDGITVTLAAAATTAATATALAANPADCGANQFATTIAASGALTCAALVDADIPNTITVDNATAAATATALAADPADCSATQFATAIAASGALSCAALTDADVPNTITVSLAAAASALAANPTACGAGDFVTDIAADGTLSCATPSGGSGLTHPQVMTRVAVLGGF